VPNVTIVTFKCGLTAPKIAEIGNFWYKFAQNANTHLTNKTRNQYASPPRGNAIPAVHVIIIIIIFYLFSKMQKNTVENKKTREY